MAFMDKVKQAMKGRSDTVERVIDAAVERAGRYSETLKKQGEGLKARARDLDDTRPDGPAPGGAADATAPTVDLTSAEAETPGPALRGDLAPPVPNASPKSGAETKAP